MANIPPKPGEKQNQTEKVRLQIDISPALNEDLEELMRVCDISTKKELINNALTAFEWMVSHVRDGQVIAALDAESGSYRELAMPALRHAARR